MKVGSSLQKRSFALGGLIALTGVAAVALTSVPAAAFIGVEIGPLGIGIGNREEPPPVVYTPAPVYSQPAPVYSQPPTVYEEPPVVYTPSYPYADYGPSYNVDVYQH